MTIPNAFISKHAQPGESTTAARKRLSAQLGNIIKLGEPPADALQRLDKILVQRKAKKEAIQRNAWQG
ncbi:MAG: hypothetical protein KAG66_10485 [Methylococcales bacterium]|nr:hypothetical protein [Methylococcales bacterium]